MSNTRRIRTRPETGPVPVPPSEGPARLTAAELPATIAAAVRRAVEADGRQWQPGGSARGLPRVPPRRCLIGCARLALRHQLTYAEGVVLAYGTFGHHAWLLDPSGCVVEPTLPQPGDLYAGIAFDVGAVARALRRGRWFNGMIIGGPW